MFAIGKLTFRSALASPFLHLLLLGLGGSIALAPRLVFFGFGEEERIVRDAGFSALRLASLLLAIAFGVARDRDRSLMVSLLSRPLTPTGIVAGRYLGALLAALIALSMLSVVHYGTLKMSFADTAAGPATRGLGAALAAAALEASVLVALAVALGTTLPRGVAALAVLAVFTLAHSNTPVALVLPTDGRLAAAALAATGYLALGAAVAETREAGA